MTTAVRQPAELIYAASQAIICFRELGRLDDARRWLARGAANDEQKAGIYNAQGYMALEEQPPRVKDALVALRRAERHQRRYVVELTVADRERDALVFLGRIWNNIGWAHQVGGQYKAAVAAYRQSLRLKKASGDVPGVAFTAANLARALYLARDYKSAARWRKRARTLCEDLGLSGQIAYMLYEIAEVAARSGRKRVAMQRLSEATGLIAGLEHRLLADRMEQLRSRL